MWHLNIRTCWINDQCQSIPINTGSKALTPMPINKYQCRSMKINTDQYFSIRINADQSILRIIDQYWSSLITIDLYWDAFWINARNLIQHWSLIQHVLKYEVYIRLCLGTIVPSDWLLSGQYLCMRIKWANDMTCQQQGLVFFAFILKITVIFIKKLHNLYYTLMIFCLLIKQRWHLSEFESNQYFLIFFTEVWSLTSHLLRSHNALSHLWLSKNYMFSSILFLLERDYPY